MNIRDFMNSKKSSRCLLILILTVFFGILTAGYIQASTDNSSLKQVKKETQELLQSLKTYTIDQRDTAVQKTKATLDKLDNHIEELEARIHRDWKNMDEATRQKARASLKSLHKQRTLVAEWYGRLTGSSAEAWDRIKQGFSDAYKVLHKAWEKAETDSTKDPKPSKGKEHTNN